jgi:ribonuclease E
MTKNMLIDAAHPEEVRVCVLENGKVEDFDFESSSRKPLRGNIYLARVTRVEPSLQAAFVEYGGNRHGFLAFNEIHPDYYQIPVSDRRLLQEAEAEEAALAAELELDDRGDAGEDEFDLEPGPGAIDDDAPDFRDGVEHAERPDPVPELIGGANGDAGGEEPAHPPEIEDAASPPETDIDAAPLRAAEPESIAADYEGEASESDGEPRLVEGEEPAEAPASADEEESESADDHSALTEESGGEPAAERAAPRRQASGRNGRRGELLERYKEARRRRARLVRNYKIQEVVKRRQILLVQVVKEERGNKGAALTTYLSLAGRYCVLMPNTARGGGISRKIPVAADRKRLRRVVDSLDVPQGMGLIIRTAGAKRTKAEIKRDYDYLIRLWENIRTLTLNSIAPCLIYEEANLIKRAIRDLYDKDIDQIEVEGDAGYREAKDFMKMLMPSHAKNVQPYKEKTPLFLKYGVESQLDAMYQPTVRLKSGGYIVIHQTEALVAIDVNSGKSTRERNIELTALKTNLEAAKEAARQCRLRDLAGLIVIDFIDMEENKNNRSVEKRLKDSLKTDRARIQIGRISNFGLLEMSRQRRRSGIVDGTTHACPACGGAGVVRSHEMAALRILRAIESEALSARSAVIAIKASLEVTLYILNHKRAWLKRIEDDYALTIEILADSTKAGDQYEIEKRGAPRELPDAATLLPHAEIAVSDAPPEYLEEEEPSLHDDAAAEDDHGERQHHRDSGAEAEGGRRRRRRRRRGGRREDGDAPRHADVARQGEEAVQSASESDSGDSERAQRGERPSHGEEGDGQRRRRRRGRRGGRRNQRRGDLGDQARADQAPAVLDSSALEQPAYPEEPEYGEAPREDPINEPISDETPPSPAVPFGERDSTELDEGEQPAKGWRDAPDDAEDALPDPKAPQTSAAEPDKSRQEPKPARKGWWQRAIGG